MKFEKIKDICKFNNIQLEKSKIPEIKPIKTFDCKFYIKRFKNQISSSKTI